MFSHIYKRARPFPRMIDLPGVARCPRPDPGSPRCWTSHDTGARETGTPCASQFPVWIKTLDQEDQHPRIFWRIYSAALGNVSFAVRRPCAQ
jgi:hypothetical protein